MSEDSSPSIRSSDIQCEHWLLAEQIQENGGEFVPQYNIISQAWKDLSAPTLRKMQGQVHLRDVASMLGLVNYDTNPKDGILLDFYVSILKFARTNNFDDEKTSTVFSVMKTTFERSMETQFCSLGESFQIFKELLVKHSVHRSPYSVCTFSLPDVKLITNFAFNTFYRHYKLYQYVFTKKTILNLRVNDFPIQLPLDIPPLALAELVPAKDANEITKDLESPRDEQQDQEVPEEQLLLPKRQPSPSPPMPTPPPTTETTGTTETSESATTIPDADTTKVVEPIVESSDVKDVVTGTQMSDSSTSEVTSAKSKLLSEVEQIVTKSTLQVLENRLSQIQLEIQEQMNLKEEQVWQKVVKLIDSSIKNKKHRERDG